jgi:chorismate mutase
MVSDSDDLEQQLQENLKLRRELVAEVAKSKAASQPDGVGFPLVLLASLYRLGHWLGLRP